MSKQFLTEVIVVTTEMPKTTAGQIADAIITAITDELVASGRFTIPGFGSFVVRETPKRTRRNPRTGEPVQVKAGATVRFKASPVLKAAALVGAKKAKRKAAKG
jgi:DNA-binding protein HU-beta